MKTVLGKAALVLLAVSGIGCQGKWRTGGSCFPPAYRGPAVIESCGPSCEGPPVSVVMVEPKKKGLFSRCKLPLLGGLKLFGKHKRHAEPELIWESTYIAPPPIVPAVGCTDCEPPVVRRAESSSVIEPDYEHAPAPPAPRYTEPGLSSEPASILTPTVVAPALRPALEAPRDGREEAPASTSAPSSTISTPKSSGAVEPKSTPSTLPPAPLETEVNPPAPDASDLPALPPALGPSSSLSPSPRGASDSGSALGLIPAQSRKTK